MKRNKIITLATLTYMRAQLLSAILERKGIQSFMTNTNRIKQAAGGVNIIIKESDFKEASKIFNDFKNAYGAEKEKAANYMKSIRKILVPVDFTKHAENAATYALQIAAKLKADIMLLNVYFDPSQSAYAPLESFAYSVDFDKITKETEKEVEHNLKALTNRLIDKQKKEKILGVTVKYDFVKGSTTEEVLTYADEYNAGLLVMGTRGKEIEGLRSFGSVTAKIIEKAKIPVLAVPKGYDAQHFTLPKKILYATDFRKADFWALSKLSTFVKPFGAKIYCVHVDLQIDKQQEELMHQIRTFVTDTLQIYNLECGLLETIDIQIGLEDFIQERKMNVLAMTTHTRSLFNTIFKPSMTRKFLFMTDIPLLVFHATPQIR